MNDNNHKPAQTRRQRRIARRRHEIVAAAAQVFAEKGYANTTTKELAEAADMAEGTLYNYFDGKREILLAILQETRAPFDDLLQNALDLQSRTDFINIVETGLNIFISQIDFTRTLLAEIWVDNVIFENFIAGRMRHIGQSVQTFIEHGIETGTFRPLDPEIATLMVLGSISALIIPVLRGAKPVPSPQACHEMAETAVDLLLDGIRIRETETITA